MARHEQHKGVRDMRVERSANDGATVATIQVKVLDGGMIYVNGDPCGKPEEGGFAAAGVLLAECLHSLAYAHHHQENRWQVSARREVA